MNFSFLLPIFHILGKTKCIYIEMMFFYLFYEDEISIFDGDVSFCRLTTNNMLSMDAMYIQTQLDELLRLCCWYEKSLFLWKLWATYFRCSISDREILPKLDSGFFTRRLGLTSLDSQLYKISWSQTRIFYG